MQDLHGQSPHAVHPPGLARHRGVAPYQAAEHLIAAIVWGLKKAGGFTLPSFGTLRVTKIKARKAPNPRTGEPVKVKAGKTVRFRVSPNLKKAV